MAEANNAEPVVKQGQMTSVAEGAQATQEQPVEGAPEAEQPNLFSSWFIWVLIAIWGFWLWSSSKNRKKQKAEQERTNDLQKGDQLITIGRMHGTVVSFTDTTVTIRPDEKQPFTMTFDRQAIFKRLPRAGEEEQTATK